jgi:hypothetical protein
MPVIRVHSGMASISAGALVRIAEVKGSRVNIKTVTPENISLKIGKTADIAIWDGA